MSSHDRPGRSEKRKARERTCVGCRQTDEPAALVRLVLAEGGSVVPDLRGTSFGRGAWVHATAACVRKAAPAGLSRSFRTQVSTRADELGRMLRDAGNRRLVGLLETARRANATASGSDAAAEALRAGAPVVIVATDARASAEEDSVKRAVAEGRAVAWGTKQRLGAALGRGETGVVAISDEGLAKALRSAAHVAHLDTAPLEDRGDDR